jgi:hypothetical protein
MSELLRYNKKQKYILFDGETTNLALVKGLNLPWQWSYILCVGSEIVHESDNYIKWPDLKLSEDARRITHFDDNKYNRLAKDPLPILNEFEKYLYDPEYLVVGQSIIGFDIYVHNIYRQLMGRKPDFSYLNRLLDTNSIAKAVKKGIKIQKEDDLTCFMFKLNDYREKGLKTSILTQLKEYKIDFDENMLHSSIYDVKMNWEIFKRQIWQIEI